LKPLVPRVTVFLVVTASLSLATPERPHAADLRAKPSLRLAQGWDSNVFNTTGNEVSDF
jgi:hypothetical protein